MIELGIETVMLLAGVAFLAGAVDAIAGGGGLLTIPALLAAGVPPVTALGTNKLQATFGTGGAVIAFARNGRIEPRRFLLPAAASLVGSAGGAWLLTRLDPQFLSGLIPFLLIAMAIYYIFAPKMGEEDRHVRAGMPLLVLIAMVIGAYDGFFGPGTGSFLTTALVAVFGLGLTRAVAHAKLLNFASNLAGLVVLVVSGHVLWALGLTMAVASVLGGQVGVHAALRFGAGAVRPLLIVVCFGLTARLLADPGNPLTAVALEFYS